MSTPLAIDELRQHLPDRIWYLSSDGRDMYCRCPYSFLFSSSANALAFASAFGTAGLSPVGVEASAIVSEQWVQTLRAMRVTRVFVDPDYDPDTGDVSGNILRFEEPN